MDRVKLDPLIPDDAGRQGAVEPPERRTTAFRGGERGRGGSYGATPLGIVLGVRQRLCDPGVFPARGARPVADDREA